jgi:hypothetical protein
VLVPVSAPVPVSGGITVTSSAQPSAPSPTDSPKESDRDPNELMRRMAVVVYSRSAVKLRVKRPRKKMRARF